MGTLGQWPLRPTEFLFHRFSSRMKSFLNFSSGLRWGVISKSSPSPGGVQFSGRTPLGMNMKAIRSGGSDRVSAPDAGAARDIDSSQGSESATPAPRRRVRLAINLGIDSRPRDDTAT